MPSNPVDTAFLEKGGWCNFNSIYSEKCKQGRIQVTTGSILYFDSNVGLCPFVRLQMCLIHSSLSHGGFAPPYFFIFPVFVDTKPPFTQPVTCMIGQLI